MKKTLLVDGMGCIYNEKFNVNAGLLNILNFFDTRKILVVNGFREEGKKVLEGNGFEAFSLQEEGLKKTNPEFFKRLMDRFSLAKDEILYFDHSEDNVKSVESLGILSAPYKTDEQIKEFIETNISY